MTSSNDSCSTIPGERLKRDWWPLTRLSIVASALTAQAYWVFGWQVPLADLLALPGRLGVVLLFLLFFSGPLDVYAFFLILPLAAVVFVNDYSYAACRWTFRKILRPRSDRLLAALSLGGELALFLYGFLLLNRLFAGF